MIFTFDMDGTVADFYNVENWLPMIRNDDPTPYQIAKPLWDMVKLVEVLNALKAQGHTVGVVTWLSKDSSKSFERVTTQAKREWLEKYNFPCDFFHAVSYGTDKASTLDSKAKNAVLFDDNEEVRNSWTIGETVNPETVDVIKYLESCLQK